MKQIMKKTIQFKTQHNKYVKPQNHTTTKDYVK